MRSVGVVTVGRSDYGIYRPVLCELAARDDTEPLLFVGGAHLLERFGSTVDEIERDGLPIARVAMLGADDSPLGVAESIARGVAGFAKEFERTRPDILLLLGDRFEMFAAGVAALPLTIPVAHLHGGETTEGAIDESMRHALTKLSHLHFASTDVYARRIEQLGEEPWRIVVSGAPALDAIRTFTPLTEEQLAERGVCLRSPTLLVTFHPVTLEAGQSAQQIDALLAAVEESGFDAVVSYSNADAGHSAVLERLDRLSPDRFTVVPSLGVDAYYTLMSRAVAMVGNSSSGIIEAASFHLPVVDVGIRQQGRIRGANVTHVEPETTAIRRAISHVTSRGFRESLESLVNPYGDGHAAPRIAETLASIPLDGRLLVKRFHDI